MAKKQLQNKIAESKLTLPVVSLYAMAVWLLCGAITRQWWLQFGGFVMATYLMILLNNFNALIRIYSRMVSCSFIVLFCAACFLFPSAYGAVLQVCYVGSLLFLFATYQDKEAAGFVYYAFLLMGIATMHDSFLLCYLPVIWLLMATQLQSFSARTMGASILGLLTPYWVVACLLIFNKDFAALTRLLPDWNSFIPTFDYAAITDSQTATWALIVLMTVTGIIHYIRKHHDDRIRTRLLFGFFIWIELATFLFMAAMPQHNDSLMRLAIVNVAPLIGHFIALSGNRLTNIYFCVIALLIFLITGYNIWTSYLS